MENDSAPYSLSMASELELAQTQNLMNHFPTELSPIIKFRIRHEGRGTEKIDSQLIN
jgi:hypothetical protein